MNGLNIMDDDTSSVTIKARLDKYSLDHDAIRLFISFPIILKTQKA